MIDLLKNVKENVKRVKNKNVFIGIKYRQVAVIIQVLEVYGLKTRTVTLRIINFNFHCIFTKLIKIIHDISFIASVNKI